MLAEARPRAAASAAIRLSSWTGAGMTFPLPHAACPLACRGVSRAMASHVIVTLAPPETG